MTKNQEKILNELISACIHFGAVQGKGMSAGDPLYEEWDKKCAISITKMKKALSEYAAVESCIDDYEPVVRMFRD